MKSLTLLVLLGCCLASCREAPEPVVPEVLTEVETYMTDPQALARGEALFIGSCIDYCHTMEPEDTDARFLFACDWQQSVSDEEIANIIRVGIPDTRMVGFGSNFPDEEADIWKLIAYLRANRWPCAEP